MQTKMPLVLAMVAGGVMSASVSGTATPAPVQMPEQCKSLQSSDFSGIQDSPTQVSEVALVQASGDEPDYCRVRGYVAPQVGFEMRLPVSNWNGKFIEIGCGGNCGDLSWTMWCPTHRGYACIVSDSGHHGKPSDGSWAYNNLQAQMDFGYRATHVTALTGKVLVTSYYGRAPGKSMMMGCSTGGYQALVEVQRFPWDFDGVVSIAPDLDVADTAMRFAWFTTNLFDAQGRTIFTAADLALLHRAALAHCDASDGLRDGIVGDPIGCSFNPATLACRSEQLTGCLGSLQVAAAKKLYGAPTKSDGQAQWTWTVLPGSELEWTSNYSNNGSTQFFRYLFTPPGGARWGISDFNFGSDYKRLGLAAMYTDSNPDLRKFKKAGGKLLIAQGTNDVAEGSGSAVVDYYEIVERTMGGRAATQDFMRLFLVPGMNHCTGGDGAFAIDYLTYLEDWVDKGHPPNKMIGAHVDEAYLNQSALGAFGLKFPLAPSVPITFTRPVYPYPVYARYAGRGNPNDSESFRPAESRISTLRKSFK